MNSIPFLPWLALMFPIAFSAGPNNLMCASSGAAYGLRQTIPFIIGLNANIALYSILAGLGLGTVVSGIPGVLTTIKYAGAIYILYLAWSFIRPGTHYAKKESNSCPGFWSGMLVNALNPKCFFAILLMYTSFFHAEVSTLMTITVLTLWIVILSVSAHITWASLGHLILGNLKSEKWIRFQNYFFAIILFLVALWIVLS